MVTVVHSKKFFVGVNIARLAQFAPVVPELQRFKMVTIIIF